MKNHGAVLALLLIVGGATAFEQCGQKGADSKIVNGKDAGHGEFPWQISLQYSPFFLIPNQHICGGTLIAPGWVLCAAHCFMQDKTPSKFTVKTGEWHIFSGDGTEKKWAVDKIIVHEQFNTPHEIEHDVALIKLKGAVDLSGPYAGAACMPEETDDYHGAQDCYLSGWGLTKKGITGGIIPPSCLQKAHGSIWKDADLKSKWTGMIQPGMIGFGTETMSACMGDSGGPLVCRNKEGFFDIVGVVSWGTGTCKGMPGVFTEVTHFLPWIKAHMQ